MVVDVEVLVRTLAERVEVLAAVGVSEAQADPIAFVEQRDVADVLGLQEERDVVAALEDLGTAVGVRVADQDAEPVPRRGQPGERLLVVEFNAEDVAGLGILRPEDLDLLVEPALELFLLEHLQPREHGMLEVLVEQARGEHARRQVPLHRGVPVHRLDRLEVRVAGLERAFEARVGRVRAIPGVELLDLEITERRQLFIGGAPDRIRPRGADDEVLARRIAQLQAWQPIGVVLAAADFRRHRVDLAVDELQVVGLVVGLGLLHAHAAGHGHAGQEVELQHQVAGRDLFVDHVVDAELLGDGVLDVELERALVVAEEPLRGVEVHLRPEGIAALVAVEVAVGGAHDLRQQEIAVEPVVDQRVLVAGLRAIEQLRAELDEAAAVAQDHVAAQVDLHDVEFFLDHLLRPQVLVELEPVGVFERGPRRHVEEQARGVVGHRQRFVEFEHPAVVPRRVLLGFAIGQ